MSGRYRTPRPGKVVNRHGHHPASAFDREPANAGAPAEYALREQQRIASGPAAANNKKTPDALREAREEDRRRP